MSSMKCGIVGLPNVGKSTLYNLLTQNFSSPAENYPFCTIDPHHAEVSVPDLRLDELSKIAESKTIIPATMGFVDIAGLVEGASRGEGLGNQFLSHIREVSVILHVVRCFENSNVMHVCNRIAPLVDVEIIDTEMILADIQSLDRRLAKRKKNSKDVEEFTFFKSLLEFLEAGNKASSYPCKDAGESHLLQGLQLLSAKKTLYVCNVMDLDSPSDKSFVSQCFERYGEENVIPVSVKLESEVYTLDDPEEKKLLIKEFKLNSLESLIRKAYHTLGKQTFFTVGKKETRAWVMNRGASALDAAAVIHTDFAKGFIKADVISYEDYLQHGGEKKSRLAGVVRSEGREYVMQDGDVVYFKFNL